jgi:hypothetical protein
MRLARYYVIATLSIFNRGDTLPASIVRLASPYTFSIFTSVMARLCLLEYFARSIQHWELGVGTLGGR